MDSTATSLYVWITKIPIHVFELSTDNNKKQLWGEKNRYNSKIIF